MDAAFLGAAVPVAFLVAAIVIELNLFDGGDRARADRLENVFEQRCEAAEELLLWMAMDDGRRRREGRAGVRDARGRFGFVRWGACASFALINLSLFSPCFPTFHQRTHTHTITATALTVSPSIPSLSLSSFFESNHCRHLYSYNANAIGTLSKQHLPSRPRRVCVRSRRRRPLPFPSCLRDPRILQSLNALSSFIASVWGL